MSTPLPTEEELGLAVNEVIQKLANQNQEELGWIYSSTRHSVNYQEQPETNARIQGRVDNAVGGVSIIYIFALLETYIPRALWKYSEDSLKKRMYAYLHIRNTVAHGFDGIRAERNVTEFDEIMDSDSPISGILSHNSDEIIVQPTVWLGLKDLIPRFLGSILHKIINYGYDAE